MRTETKIWNLIVKLADLSNQGRVDWQTTFDENAFQVSFPSNTVEIAELSGYEDSKDYEIRLKDADGKLIEEMGDNQLKTSLNVNAFGTMRSLFGDARAKALGVDGAIDSLMGSLKVIEDDIPF